MKVVVFFLSILVCANSWATEVDNKDPFKLVQSVAKDLFERIAREQKEIQKDPEVLRTVVAEQLAPHINHVYAGSMVLGPYYRKVSDQEKTLFFESFRKYLIATYAGILTLYKDQKVVFEPSSEVKGKRVQVKVRVLDEGRPDINIGFILRKNSKGEWSAYDMVAEGISVLSSKQKELQGQIRQQGIASVTALLSEKAAKPIVLKEIGNY
mgnify:CR=1 FL=1